MGRDEMADLKRERKSRATLHLHTLGCLPGAGITAHLADMITSLLETDKEIESRPEDYSI